MPKIFRHTEDFAPVTCIVALSVLDFLVYLRVDSIAWLGLWMIAVVVPKICICSWNHHHQHIPTFRFTALNRLLEIVYALHTGITTNAWVLHHVLGHHVNYLDQKKDESGWMRRNGTTMGVIEYTLTIALTGYWRAFVVGRRHPKYQRSFLNMGVLTILLAALLTYFNWVNALMIYLAPMAIGYLVTCWHTYCHHAGLHTENHFEASHNIMHRWYNVMTGNLGFHTAHHVKPGLHWSKLPEYHATIAHKIPSSLYIEPCIPFCWIPDRRGQLFIEQCAADSLSGEAISQAAEG